MAKDSKSIYVWAAKHIAGTYSDPAEAAKRLAEAAEYCRLIGGAAITPMVEGHEVMVTVIPIEAADTYPLKASKDTPERLGIGKATLMTISNAAGVEWLDTQRLDDGHDPHFCHIKAIGRYLAIDGKFKPIEGEKDSDLRKGSEQIAGMSDFQVSSLRATNLRSTITKAKLRGLREAFGVPHGVLKSEVDKPFVFAKVIFTGRSDDPENRRMFAQVLAMQQLAATSAMYGGEMPSMQLPPASVTPSQLADPRPIRTLPAHAEVIDAEPVYRAPAPPPAPTAQRPQQPAKQSQGRPPNRQSAPRAKGTPEDPNGPDGVRVASFGKYQHEPLGKIPTDYLKWYANALQSRIDDPGKDRWRNENEAELNDVQSELEMRAAAGDTGEGQPEQATKEEYPGRDPNNPNDW